MPKQDNNDKKKKYNLRKKRNSTDDNKFDQKKFRELLNETFPSKYLTNKTKEDEEKTAMKDEVENEVISDNSGDGDVNDPDYETETTDTSSEDNNMDEDDEESTEEDSDEDSDEDENSIKVTHGGKNGKMQPFKIVLNLKNSFMDDNDEMEEDCDSSDTGDDNDDILESYENEKKSLEEFKEQTEKFINENEVNKNVFIKKSVNSLKKKLLIKQNKLKEKESNLQKNLEIYNNKKFKKLMAGNNSTNEFKYFKNLAYQKQKSIIGEMEKINEVIQIDKPYLHKILETNIPLKFKAVALKKINSFQSMIEGTGEYTKLKNWIDSFMCIPFNNVSKLPLTIDDGIDESHKFIMNAKDILDNCVYGLEDVKLQILQMIGQWISNPNAMGNAIAIKGPMGTGKTTLVKDGISKILNRPFAFIPLGGATDSSFLEGHSYTYEGSNWGKIVDTLMQTRTMNPVFYFDELDKISATPKGEEINGILTHLTDVTQNNQFNDKYFSEIDFDLSKCLFIFSYNNEEDVNPILRDRMYKINTKGYKKEDKQIITKKFLIPTIEEQMNFEENKVLIDDEMINHIIEKFTDNEKGVRNLKRCIETIYSKLNLYKLTKPDHHLYEKTLKLKVNFPFKVDKSNIETLLTLHHDTTFVPTMYL
jgi:ATP-dependent Lon protease